MIRVASLHVLGTILDFNVTTQFSKGTFSLRRCGRTPSQYLTHFSSDHAHNGHGPMDEWMEDIFNSLSLLHDEGQQTLIYNHSEANKVHHS